MGDWDDTYALVLGNEVTATGSARASSAWWRCTTVR